MRTSVMPRGVGHGRFGRLRRTLALALAGLGLAAGGCLHADHAAQPLIAPPPDGSVPRELKKVMLPEYVIEPPDVLRIEALIRVPEVDEKTKETARDPKTNKVVFTKMTQSTPLQPVFGDYTVRPDGRVYLGIFESVPVAGLTVSQAAAAVRAQLIPRINEDTGGLVPESLLVVLDVAQYNSKRVTVFLDNGGQGEQVFALPVTGSECVLDAITSVGGLPPTASKRNIWVARRTPHVGQPEQILPVDWVGISQHGVTATNYQLMPGDRVYVKSQRLVTVYNSLDRFFNPIERVFGFALLGSSTVNQISGRGTGFNGR